MMIVDAMITDGLPPQVAQHVEEIEKRIEANKQEIERLVAENAALSAEHSAVHQTARAFKAHYDSLNPTPVPGRRNIRAEVLEMAGVNPGLTISQMAEKLAIRHSVADKAVSHWHAKGKLHLASGRICLGPEPDTRQAAAE
jgi:hypothetical protein